MHRLHGLCPFCQQEMVEDSIGRISRDGKTHLKFCCFFHKVENGKYRKLFNTLEMCEKNREYTAELQRTSVLTLQTMITNKHFLLNTLQFEVESGSNLYFNNKNEQSHKQYEREVNVVQQFHSSFTLLGDDNFPDWFHIFDNEITHEIDVLVLHNCLTFDQSENIDCRLIRLLSIRGSKYRSFKYTLNFNEFVDNIKKFEECVVNKCFVITRYIHMFISKTGQLSVSFIVILPRSKCCKHLRNMRWSFMEISNIDNFIDVCYDMSNDDQDPLQFLPSKSSDFVNLTYAQDVLLPKPNVINMTTSSDVTQRKIGFNKFFSPLGKHAKVYFYSQTRHGCARAFDRLLQKDNLNNYINDVLQENGENGKCYINYSSLYVDKRVQMFKINLPPDQTFAGESFYRESYFQCYYFEFSLQSMKGMKIFFLNSENLKIVIDNGVDSETNNGEFTYFPNCLLATNIKYFLSNIQTNTYKVVQLNRGKLLLESNKIPQFEDAIFN